MNNPDVMKRKSRPVAGRYLQPVTPSTSTAISCPLEKHYPGRPVPCGSVSFGGILELRAGSRFPSCCRQRHPGRYDVGRVETEIIPVLVPGDDTSFRLAFLRTSLNPTPAGWDREHFPRHPGPCDAPLSGKPTRIPHGFMRKQDIALTSEARLDALCLSARYSANRFRNSETSASCKTWNGKQ